MITAICVIGLAVAVALWAGLGRAATIIAVAVAKTVSDATESIASSGIKVRDEYRLRGGDRMLFAAPGTRLAHAFATKDGVEIGYGPVLAIVESQTGGAWAPLALIAGELQLRDCFIERVLLPGETLSDVDCAEMKRRYIETIPPAELRHPDQSA